MSLTEFPHIYKKEQILRLKPLAKLNNERKFYFNSLKGTIPSIVYHCNNINEIVGRCFLGIAKLNSFFGLSRDPSDKMSVSKSPSVWNQARTIFKSGGGNGEKHKELVKLLEKALQDQKILEKKLDDLRQEVKVLSSKIEPEPLTKSDIEFTSETLRRIDESLKSILGI